MREAEVVKQVRESDFEPSTHTAASSPSLTANHDGLDDVPEPDMMSDLAQGLSGSFKPPALKNNKAKAFWDTFSESSSVGGARTTPPPPSFMPRDSSSGVSEDIAMDSPSVNGAAFPVCPFPT